MGPEPQFGALADLLFQQLCIAVRDVIIGMLLCGRGYGNDRSHIVTPFGTGNLYIEDGGIDLLANLFRTDKEGGGVVKEVGPVVHGFPLGALVGNEGHEFLSLVAACGENVAQGFLHGHASASELGTQTKDEAVDDTVFERMVNL